VDQGPSYDANVTPRWSKNSPPFTLLVYELPCSQEPTRSVLNQLNPQIQNLSLQSTWQCLTFHP